MAITSTAIPAGDLTNRAANKPLVVGRNVLEKAYGIAPANLVANTAGTIGGGDASDAAYGRRFLTNRQPGHLWKFGSSVTDLFLVMDLGAADASKDVDTFIVQGHNWDTCTITVEADNTAPAGVAWGGTGSTTVFSIAPVSGNALIVRLHATTMYKARYWRIRIQRGTGFVAQAAQVWLGKAIQFPVKSRYDWSPPEASASEVLVKKTKGGIRHAYRMSGSLQRRSQTFEIGDVPTGTFLTDLKDFWDNADALAGGGRCFWYVEDPTASPGVAKFVYSIEPRFDVVQDGPYTSKFRLETTEQGGG